MSNKPKIGRKPTLTPALLKKLITNIKKTTTIKMACAITGISQTAYYKWHAIGRELMEEYEDFEEIPEKDKIFVELVESVEVALQESCLPAIDTIMRAIKEGDVKAAERLLARRLPDDFGDYNRKEIVVKHDITDDMTGIAYIPTSEIDEDIDDIFSAQQRQAKQLAIDSVEALDND